MKIYSDNSKIIYVNDQLPSYDKHQRNIDDTTLFIPKNGLLLTDSYQPFNGNNQLVHDNHQPVLENHQPLLDNHQSVHDKHQPVHNNNQTVHENKCITKHVVISEMGKPIWEFKHC